MASLPGTLGGAPRGGFLGAVPTGPLVARGAEMDRVRDALASAVGGEGRLVLLSGEPGVGKTRLAQEVMLKAFEHGARVLVGHCYDEYTPRPFQPFQEAFGVWFASAPSATRKEIARLWPQLVHLIPDLSSRPAVVADEGQDAHGQLVQAAVGLVQYIAADVPLALLIDDLHWADTSSLDLLLHLARQVLACRVFLLGTYREPDLSTQVPLEKVLHELVHDRLVDEVHLVRLPIEGTARLIGAHLGSAIDDNLAALVHARTDGNAFFVEEVLKALVERGDVYQAAGRWLVRAIVELDVPRNVRSAIRRRVGRLSRQSQELLVRASVLGQEFDLDLLLATADQPEENVLDDLDAALEAHLLETRRTSSLEMRYVFAHALVREALYEEQPPHRLRRLHQRAGVAFERLRSGRPEAWADMARHFVIGGDAERATDYCILAGGRAAELYAYAEAARQFELALELVAAQSDTTVSARSADIHLRLGEALVQAGRIEDGFTHLRQALATYERLRDSIGQARAHRQIAWVYQRQYRDFAVAAPYLEAALRLWPTAREDAEYARLLVDIVRAKVFSRDTVAAATLAETALQVAERLEDAALIARALIEMHLAMTAVGHSNQAALPLLDRAEVFAYQIGDIGQLCRIYTNRGYAKQLTGDLEGCRDDARQAVIAFEAARWPAALAMASWIGGRASMDMGNWEEGRATARHQVGPPPLRVIFAWMSGAHEQALDALREVIAAAWQSSDIEQVIDYDALLADLALQLGDVPTALAAAREAADTMRTRQTWGQVGSAFGPLAEAVVRGHARDAEAVLSEAEARINQLQHLRAQPALLRARGVLAQRCGDSTSAMAALLRSAEISRSQHAAIELGRTLLVLADVARRADHLTLAREADAERAAIVERIGPQARGLAWAEDIGAAPGIARRSSAPIAGSLSPREREIATLIADGLSNHEIAEALVITERTAANHIQHILNKLGFHSRAQIAAWVVERSIGTQA